MMNPFQAVGSALMNAFNFSGRASRSEYWWFFFMLFFAFFAATIFDGFMLAAADDPSNAGLPIMLLSLLVVAIFPCLSIQIRRLHDIDFSGWWYLLSFVPFGGIALMVMACMPSHKYPNKWGDPHGYARLPGADIFNDKPINDVPEIFKPGNIYGPDKNAPIQSPAELNAARKAEVSAYYKSRVLNQNPT